MSYLIYINLGLRGININYISQDTTNGKAVSWIQDLINRRDRLSVTGIDQKVIFDGDYDDTSFNYPQATSARTCCQKEGDFSRSVLSIQAAQELVSCWNHYLSPNQLVTSRLPPIHRSPWRWPCKIMRWIDDRTMSRRTRSRIYERDVFDLWDGILGWSTIDLRENRGR